MRRANLEDITEILDLEKQRASAAHWPRQQYEAMLTAASESLSEHLVLVVDEGAADDARRVGTRALGLLGFLVAHRVGAEWELQNLVVASQQQRKGIGSALIQGLISVARAHAGASIFLEVRESNHEARALYQRLGFSETGLRKGYYPDPPEGAILCELKL